MVVTHELVEAVIVLDAGNGSDITELESSGWIGCTGCSGSTGTSGC